MGGYCQLLVCISKIRGGGVVAGLDVLGGGAEQSGGEDSIPTVLGRKGQHGVWGGWQSQHRRIGERQFWPIPCCVSQSSRIPRGAIQFLPHT